MSLKRVTGWIWAAAIVIATAGQAAALVTVPNIIGSNMVLQQGRPVPVWGSAAPGETVTVAFSGQQISAEADADGRWTVHLAPLEAGGPHTMTIRGAENELMLANILVGEVWLGSGQSNMQWTIANSANPDEEIAAANYPEIRLFYAARTPADTPQEDVEGQWVVCSPETIAEFSAVLYYFGRTLHQELGLPMGLVHSSWGGTPAEAWTRLQTMAEEPSLTPLLARWDEQLARFPEAQAAYEKELAAWEQAAEQAKAEGKDAPARPRAPQGPDSPHRPANLFNGMIAPIAPYAIQGAVWYQGESNASRAYQYRTLFPLMIEDWRMHWNQGDFSFYFVQLANFMERKAEPADSAWAELREAQNVALHLPKTGVALAIDIGEANDIHPKNKQDVGRRLALNALAKDYGRDAAYSGPMYTWMDVRDGRIILHFDHVDGGLKAKDGQPLTSFAIAGADRNFVWAKAEIQGDTVVVSSEAVPHPVAVRYAWADNPDVSLYNGAGLPASPFRTDFWPGITGNNH